MVTFLRMAVYLFDSDALRRKPRRSKPDSHYPNSRFSGIAIPKDFWYGALFIFPTVFVIAIAGKRTRHDLDLH